MVTKFEAVLGEGPPPPPPPEDRDVEPPKKAEKRRAAERRRKAERAPGEVPPKPITEKFPGEAPPYPAGYTPPEGKVAEVDAKGRPTVIVTSAGLRQFTPNATMFKMGYVNSDQYAKSGVARGDKFVSATAFLPITSEKGEALMIDKEVAFRLREQRPKQQFASLKEMGVIEHNTKFVPGFGGKWSFVPTREVARVKGIKGQVAFDKKRIAEFKKTHIELPDDNWLLIKDWNTIPEKYQNIALKKGYTAMTGAIDNDNKAIDVWESQHIIIGNQAMPIKSFQGHPVGKDPVIGWNDLDAKYKAIATQQNSFDAMLKAIKVDEAAQDKAIATMEKYKTEKGYDLLVAAHDGVDSKTMELAGFKAESIKWADESLQAAKDTGVALPGVKTWQNVESNKIITNEQYKALKGTERDFYRLSPESGRRLLTVGASALFFSPARMALPEVKKGDIKPLDYAVGAGQLAAWAVPFMPKGIVPYAMTGIGSTFGLHTAVNWNEMSTTGKIMGATITALMFLPAVGAIVKTAIPVAVKVPTAAGDITIWKGVKFNGKPIIGISGSRLAIGTRGVKLPQFAEITTGFKPATKIETSLLGTRRALEKMGVSEADIIRVETTLDTRGMFAGKKSPFLSKEIQPEGIKSLSPEGVGEVFKASIAEGKQVEKIYGSYTMKPQLKPELRLWREPGDIDIQTSMSQADTVAFTKKLLGMLQKTEGSANVRISAKTPTLIEVRDATGWHHAVDIHATDIGSISSEIEKLGTTGAYSYGMKVAEPVASIKYPGVGTLKIMRLSETGKRKVDAILHFRKTGIAPEPHRIKDIVDYYVILRTFKGKEIADKWAIAWGKNPDALIKLAAKNPPKLAAWELSPTEAIAEKGTPSVSILVPDYMNAGLSPSLRASIASSAAISPSAVASGYTIRTSPGSVSTSTPSGKSPSLITSPSVPTRAISRSVRTGIVPVSSGLSALLKLTSIPRPKPSPVAKPSVAPSPKPSVAPSPKPSVAPKPSVSPKPSVAPSPKPQRILSPTPSPSPAPVPVPVPGTPPPVFLPGGAPDKETRKRIKAARGAIAWRQGELAGKPVYHVLMHPYASKTDYVIVVGRKPAGASVAKGKGSAYRSIRRLSGKAPSRTIAMDLGIMDVKISPKGQGVGIEFSPDPKQVTTGDITITRRLPPLDRGRGGLGRRLPRITPKTPRLRR